MVKDALELEFNSFVNAQKKTRARTLAGQLQLATDRLIHKDSQEYLDDPKIPVEKRFKLVESSVRIAAVSGYYRTVLEVIQKHILPLHQKTPSRTFRIMDIGAGAGGSLEATWRWAQKHQVKVELIALDLDAEFLALTKKRLAARGIPVQTVCGDAAKLNLVELPEIDFITSVHMVHHLRSIYDVASLFAAVSRVARVGACVMDIDRVWWAPLFMSLGFLFGPPFQIRLDGIRSARRAYTRDEINFLLQYLHAQKKINTFQLQTRSSSPHWILTITRG